MSRRRSPASVCARRIRRTTVAVGWRAVAAARLVRSRGREHGDRVPDPTTTWPSASSRAITRRTVRSQMFAFRAIVAADGQHPVPSSREHASARASNTRRSLPDVGEFAHTQFITAMLNAFAFHCAKPRARGSVSDPGSEMGAEGRWQARSRAAYVPAQERLTCADAHKQTEHDPVYLADTEEVMVQSQYRPLKPAGQQPDPRQC